MTELEISEAGSVQFPMIRHAAEVGWTPLPPQAALRKRGGEAGMLFHDELEAALHRFNPWLDDDAVRAAVERIEALPATIEGNREMLAWLRGQRQWYDEAEERHRPVQLIDFERPDANVLQVTWEWKVKPPARKGNREAAAGACPNDARKQAGRRRPSLETALRATPDPAIERVREGPVRRAGCASWRCCSVCNWGRRCPWCSCRRG